MHIQSRRRTLLALAGATTGLAALLTPTAAYAGPAPERTAPEPVAPQPGAADGDLVATAAVCQSWTDYVTGPGTPFNVAIPSTTRNGGESNCILAQGHATDGVYKLQDALIRCYGQSIGKDGIFGAQTAAAVRNAQRIHGLAVDGVYGPNTRAAMIWPKYYNGNFNHC
ncbi:peptidoglycan-binding domain-containing protein [Micromonospora sp. NPDC047074]|uniref:peptidoglycan-binding domain-containing protein n=1 Tax=Micromonospora sp. NPDC047074 TaxID=3154339 RepID=UPI0033F3899F